ncbi:hypothetical protein SAMN06272771_1833 [Streptomyces sp. Ag82_O1-12]|nr:hypothetical protein SAMN06272771_1833 [Streptomyces sp. Ag82_O1-12]SOD44528.1 hypothetical protein SAMN06272727_1824 [Streptomyces sp. Ag82_G6-1]
MRVHDGCAGLCVHDRAGRRVHGRADRRVLVDRVTRGPRG